MNKIFLISTHKSFVQSPVRGTKFPSNLFSSSPKFNSESKSSTRLPKGTPKISSPSIVRQVPWRRLMDINKPFILPKWVNKLEPKWKPRPMQRSDATSIVAGMLTVLTCAAPAIYGRIFGYDIDECYVDACINFLLGVSLFCLFTIVVMIIYAIFTFIIGLLSGEK